MKNAGPRLAVIGTGFFAVLVVAAIGVLVVDAVRERHLTVVDQQREAEMQKSARRDPGAAVVLAAENERRTARSLVVRERTQAAAWILIAGSAGFVAMARRVTVFDWNQARPPCKRGDKCQVLKLRRNVMP